MKRISSASRILATRQAFAKILVAVESPETAEKAADLAVALATLNHAELVVMHVTAPSVAIIPPFGAGMPLVAPASAFAMNQEEEKRTARWMSRFVWEAEERGIRSTAKTVPADRPVAEQVSTVAEEEDVDLIVTGTNKRNTLERFIFGSVSSDVLRRAKCPVLVVN